MHAYIRPIKRASQINLVAFNRRPCLHLKCEWVEMKLFSRINYSFIWCVPMMVLRTTYTMPIQIVLNIFIAWSFCMNKINLIILLLLDVVYTDKNKTNTSLAALPLASNHRGINIRKKKYHNLGELDVNIHGSFAENADWVSECVAQFVKLKLSHIPIKPRSLIFRLHSYNSIHKHTTWKRSNIIWKFLYFDNEFPFAMLYTRIPGDTT